VLDGQNAPDEIRKIENLGVWGAPKPDLLYSGGMLGKLRAL
jgi:hypothetical protein